MNPTKIANYPKYLSIRWVLIVLRFTAVSSILVAPKTLPSLYSASNNNKTIGWDEVILENYSHHARYPHSIPFSNGSLSSLSNQRRRSLQKCVRNGRQLISAVRNIPKLKYTKIDICSKYIAIYESVNMTGSEPLNQGMNLDQKIVDFRCRLRKCILDAKGLSRHFYGDYSTITFRGIVFMNGNGGIGGVRGGSMDFNFCTVTLIRCDMLNNTANWKGGGMNLYQSNLLLYGDNNASTPNLFENNAAFEGGAISVDYCNVTTEGYLLFRNNTAGSDGSAIATDHSYVNINNVAFRNNLAGYWGGAVRNQYSDFILRNVDFVGNIASRGAAFYHQGDRKWRQGLVLLMENVTLINNTAYENGMVYIAETGADARNVSFSKTSNDAEAYDMLLGNDLVYYLDPCGDPYIVDRHSGLNLPLSPPNRRQTRRDLEHEESLQQRLLNPCVFTAASLNAQVNACDNAATGILCIVSICAKLIRIPNASPTNGTIGSGINLTNKKIKLVCRQTKWRCTLDGRGLSRIFYGENASVTFRDIIFANGYDANTGGAVMMTTGSMVNFWNCSFYNNTASSGSAIAVYDDTTLVVGGTRTTFLNNHGDTPPLFIYLSTIDLSDAFFDQNQAATYGGGGLLLFGSSVNVFNVTFSNLTTTQSDDCSIFIANDNSSFSNGATCLNLY